MQTSSGYASHTYASLWFQVLGTDFPILSHYPDNDSGKKGTLRARSESGLRSYLQITAKPLKSRRIDDIYDDNEVYRAGIGPPIFG